MSDVNDRQDHRRGEAADSDKQKKIEQRAGINPSPKISIFSCLADHGRFVETWSLRLTQAPKAARATRILVRPLIK
jgi:hypothetical protein